MRSKNGGTNILVVRPYTQLQYFLIALIVFGLKDFCVLNLHVKSGYYAGHGLTHLGGSPSPRGDISHIIYLIVAKKLYKTFCKKTRTKIINYTSSCKSISNYAYTVYFQYTCNSCSNKSHKRFPSFMTEPQQSPQQFHDNLFYCRATGISAHFSYSYIATYM